MSERSGGRVHNPHGFAICLDSITRD
ncbi:MAG TPA: hypothetical protein VN641_01015 [Urbifossiella sp.]|nr:hypothetical protein [Urbifossiella sp.]